MAITGMECRSPRIKWAFGIQTSPIGAADVRSPIGLIPSESAGVLYGLLLFGIAIRWEDQLNNTTRFVRARHRAALPAPMLTQAVRQVSRLADVDAPALKFQDVHCRQQLQWLASVVWREVD